MKRALMRENPMGNLENIMAAMEDEIDEQDLLFNAYYEGELTATERADFDDRMAEDPEFAAAYQEFFDMMGGLRELPFEFAPDDFVDRVRGRIRTRSHGRFFGQEWIYSTRVPYEVVAVVMMIVMAGTYMLMETPHDRGLATDGTDMPKLSVTE
jgi:anti-sigma factor RsiW